MLNEPIITIISDKLLVGISIRTSLAESKMPMAWQRLMPRRKEINNIGNDMYSIQVYDNDYAHGEFTFDTQFTYIAGIEVVDHNHIPDQLEAITLKGGQYAIFRHKGDLAAFRKTFDYIHLEWMPNSPYQLDHRNQFEVLGAKYLGQDNPNSEEDVWVPICPK
ncbi:GyrI-like domain-containing protein [Spongiivirga citrea]|uniref:GyrI-like domain-containing protein n=1 Tax=Spongiivirga citrea TaxID=1481457 RepID=A0A6M0CLT2_9FLAO|nr:GyrI-like domain-containing protein [Spongiivirga citrea]NER18622.1 GyrI-like domain-containing protein [Spongiivirga citrea]